MFLLYSSLGVTLQMSSRVTSILMLLLLLYWSSLGQMAPTQISPTIKNDTSSLGIVANSSEIVNQLDQLTSILSISKPDNTSEQLISPFDRNRLLALANKITQIAVELFQHKDSANDTSSDEKLKNKKEEYFSKLNKSSKSFPGHDNSKAKNAQSSTLNRFHFKDHIPVDLHNPCNMNEQTILNQRQDYYEDISSSQTKNDLHGQDLIKDFHSEENEDNWLNDSLNHTEEENHLKLSITKLIGKSRIGFDLLREMIIKANYLQELVTNMIRKNLIKECQYLELPTIFEIEKEHYVDRNLVESLGNVYQALTNQTAHLYFIWSQQRKHYRRLDGCAEHGSPGLQIKDPSKIYSPDGLGSKPNFNKRAHIRRVSDDFLLVSSNLRGLMCYFKQAFQLFDLDVPTKKIVQQVMEHSIHSSSACVRLSILDCQIMRNAVKIFANIEEFLRTQSGRFFRPETISTKTHS